MSLDHPALSERNPHEAEQKLAEANRTEEQISHRTEQISETQVEEVEREQDVRTAIRERPAALVHIIPFLYLVLLLAILAVEWAGLLPSAARQVGIDLWSPREATPRAMLAVGCQAIGFITLTLALTHVCRRFWEPDGRSQRSPLRLVGAALAGLLVLAFSFLIAEDRAQTSGSLTGGIATLTSHRSVLLLTGITAAMSAVLAVCIDRTHAAFQASSLARTRLRNLRDSLRHARQQRHILERERDTLAARRLAIAQEFDAAEHLDERLKAVTGEGPEAELERLQLLQTADQLSVAADLSVFFRRVVSSRRFWGVVLLLAALALVPFLHGCSSEQPSTGSVTVGVVYDTSTGGGFCHDGECRRDVLTDLYDVHADVTRLVDGDLIEITVPTEHTSAPVVFRDVVSRAKFTGSPTSDAKTVYAAQVKEQILGLALPVSPNGNFIAGAITSAARRLAESGATERRLVVFSSLREIEPGRLDFRYEVPEPAAFVEALRFRQMLPEALSGVPVLVCGVTDTPAPNLQRRNAQQLHAAVKQAWEAVFSAVNAPVFAIQEHCDGSTFERFYAFTPDHSRK